jgi:hypothetical protein
MALVTFSVQAQFQSVQYDFEKNWFGENQRLPAENPWMLTGPLPPGVQMIEVEVHGTTDVSRTPQHVSVWHNIKSVQKPTFSIPVNYNLRGNSEYTIAMKFYKPASRDEVRELRDMVAKAANAYLDLNVVSSRNAVNLQKNPRMMRQDLDKLVGDGLSLYRNELNFGFPGFSQLVADQLSNMEQIRLKEGRFNISGKDSDEDVSTKVQYFQQQLENLKQLVQREIDQYLSYNFYVLEISRIVPDYKTEKTRNVLPINVGYGVVYENARTEEFEYATSPYVGFSVPLANAKFSGKFWSNSSLSAGVFVRNFDINDEITYTGPFIERPFYLAYGYKVANFIRLNAGATALEQVGGNQHIYVRPFMGISVEFGLWLGLGK